MTFSLSSHSVSACITALAILATGCKDFSPDSHKADSLAIRKSIPEMPPIPADSAITKMHVEKGFKVQLVAAEPLIAAPVAISFDKKGRVWVVEMQDYMPDTAGTGEDTPTGKIVILSDKNGDGTMDNSQVFLDSLVLPRAICLIDDGILVAEPPKLWYYTIKDDKPVHKTLVDSVYAEGGNVEHQPNGLYRALDNWIYNAKSAKRYKKVGNHWLIERTHFRGQWGITEDDFGRLYYNTNSDNLLGDYFPPGMGAWNEHARSIAGFGQKIVRDNRVYPIRPTTGVNRGYVKGVLDDSLRLLRFTAACGPVIYTGDLFDSSYQGNAFVAEPAANLIKRDLLFRHGYITTGKEAYNNKEFLASEDERFRPVYLSNGPDGALYIVDMYRGIIQHKTYLTPYLKSEIKNRALSGPLNCGRIYKVIPLDKKPETSPWGAGPEDWVRWLESANGWKRSAAQQWLVDARDKKVIPALRRMLNDTLHPVSLIRALWTLEGLEAVTSSDIGPLLHQSNPEIRTQAISILSSVLHKQNYRMFLPILQSGIDTKDTLEAPYIAFVLHALAGIDAPAAHRMLLELIRTYPDNIYVSDAVISNLYNKENEFYTEARSIHPDTGLAINRRLKTIREDIARNRNSHDSKELIKAYPKGAALFQTVCQTCHGADGNGVTALGPPLNGSNWVQGDKNQLIPIILYGLTGPVRVAGKLYKSPEINGEMPDIGSNKEYTDEDLAQVLSFIRAAWNNNAPKIKAEDIGNVRTKMKDRQKPFTMEELEKLSQQSQD